MPHRKFNVVHSMTALNCAGQCVRLRKWEDFSSRWPYLRRMSEVASVRAFGPGRRPSDGGTARMCGGIGWPMAERYSMHAFYPRQSV